MEPQNSHDERIARLAERRATAACRGRTGTGPRRGTGARGLEAGGSGDGAPQSGPARGTRTDDAENDATDNRVRPAEATPAAPVYRVEVPLTGRRDEYWCER